MSKSVHRLLGIAAACAVCASSALAASIPLGFVSWDVSIPGSTGRFDISNLSGGNAAPPDFPITTALSLSSLSLTVNFLGGGTTVYGSSYFSLNLDGFSFDGADIAIGGGNPLPIDATLTGTFSTTSITVDSVVGAVTILPTFSASILPSAGNTTLGNGDFGLINVETTTGTGGTTPEPSSLLLAGLAVALAVKWSAVKRPQGALRLAHG
jgi:uncharacterized OsmC-like protein